ncbi:glycosyltransferase family 2 protein [Patescibacteria group bacterium]|nr:glycosyltransferase family 2 protein [Patescibacteria group bacterium]MBU0777358.1 glycosyltransferase family 2 protein [Patescibacteria group bacterium]MBU0845986.1 glycosyltransferase family 2 protein [Patescibacteria group bacterium]MBU0922534.1 glycosyltransferase family 2 protein [Patescibacteria group bacterium]MBU1066533.1 glycosyltransferase family 2 protein [Patescibacteria group bacterium]
MTKQNKLSVVLSTYNEEKNVGDCLESVKDIADEIVVVDGSSTDRTREIAKEFGARVIKTTNPRIFHINKQKVLVAAKYDWILQIDADERLSKSLAKEIIKVIEMSDEEIGMYQKSFSEKKQKLFNKHKRLLDERDGTIGKDNEPYAGFFVPRLNYFLGKYLKYGGVYPDGVIRLVKNGKAYFPAKDVHELMVVNGKVGWLQNDLIHMADPTFERYLKRNSKYIDLIADGLKRDKVGKNPIKFIEYYFIKSIGWFFVTQIRHKGILDGFQGIVFSFFSALRFPRAYWRYLVKR